MPISEPILSENAKHLHKIMHSNNSSFSQSAWWQWRFCKRHGIYNLLLQGEKLSADSAAGDELVSSLNDAPTLSGPSVQLEQDRPQVLFCLLPGNTLAASFKLSASGRKANKERVTINA